MDEKFLELAEELENAQRDHAIMKSATLAAPESHPDFDGTHCIECDNDIPEGRLRLGRIRCVYCQTIKEKRRA